MSRRPPALQPSARSAKAEARVVGERAASRPCAICGRPAQDEYRPFCSKRCADVDLNRWLSGVYAVPAASEDEPDLEHDPEKDAG